MVSAAACAPALKDLKPDLAATDSGPVWFASAGSLVWSSDGMSLKPGEPMALSGELAFPPGTGPFPAVVLAHGCGSARRLEGAWGRSLREWGYATFVVDSLRGRGLLEVCTNALTLVPTQRVPDAYGALRILATHPRIDARRVALMGFSHGGILSLDAATAWARQTYAPDGHPRFRAFVAFYPYCNAVYPEREHISAPLRIHIGEVDDWTAATSCARLVQSLKASGQDATLTVYPGAHHGFDNGSLGLWRLTRVDNGIACDIRSASILGPLPSPSELAGCLRKGGTVAGDPTAAERARHNVRVQLEDLLK